jgi:hypothetical protein
MKGYECVRDNLLQVVCLHLVRKNSYMRTKPKMNSFILCFNLLLMSFLPFGSIVN